MNSTCHFCSQPDTQNMHMVQPKYEEKYLGEHSVFATVSFCWRVYVWTRWDVTRFPATCFSSLNNAPYSSFQVCVYVSESTRRRNYFNWFHKYAIVQVKLNLFNHSTSDEHFFFYHEKHDREGLHLVFIKPSRGWLSPYVYRPCVFHVLWIAYSYALPIYLLHCLSSLNDLQDSLKMMTFLFPRISCLFFL